MAFGDSILSKFDPDPIEMMDPAYEGVGELEDVDDEVDDFIDQIAYGGAFESVMPATGCDIDCDDDDCDDECDEDDLDEDDDDLEDFLDDENEFFGEDGPDLSEVEESAMCMLNPDACCAAFEATVKAKAKRKGNNNFANMSPAQRRQMFVKMIMNNRKLSAAEKKARIAKYDSNHPATEALSAILPDDDTSINDGEDIFADILDNAYSTSDFPDPDACNRARHSAGLRTSTTRKDDLDALIHDLVFSGDKQASHSANLKTSYARESAMDDDDFFTL